MLEQLLGLERLAEEYSKVANEDISDNAKLSVAESDAGCSKTAFAAADGR